MIRSHPGRRRAKAASVAAAVVAASITPLFAGSAAAAPSVTTGGPFTYTEQDPPMNIGTGTSIGGGDFYDGKFIDFEITGGTADETLALEQSTTPSIVDGEVSVVGTTVYVGDGTSATPIGSIDSVSNGQGGTKLRVNVGSDFQNPGFETGSVAPWTVIDSNIDLGVTSIAGYVVQDQSTYPASCGRASGPVTDPNCPPTEDTVIASSYFSGVDANVTSPPSEGSNSLRLWSDLVTPRCAVVHGPAAYSNAFDVAGGSTLYFDWRAANGGDAFHVYGYLLNTTTGVQTPVLDEHQDRDSQPPTAWAQASTVVPTTGTYRFVFVSGSFDASCGTIAGASLYLDNFQVFGTGVVDADLVSEIAQLLTYENTSDDPAASRTVTVTAENVSDETDSGTITVNIAPVNDLPTAAPFGHAWTNDVGDDTFADITGTLSFSDPDDTTFTFGIQGGTPGSYSPAGGGSYDVLLSGTYADLYVDSTTGDYRLVANDPVVEAVTDPTTEPFTVTADDGDDTGSTTLTLGIDLPPSPRNVVGTPGDTEISVDWDLPFDTAGVTGYVATVAPGGQSCTTTDVNDTDCTITGLTNGTDYVITVTTTGTGIDSLPSDPVTPVGPPTAPLNVTGAAGDGRILVEWDPPANDGGSPITGYTVTTSPDGATCTTTGATFCTVLGLALGQTYSVTVNATNALGTGPDAGPVSVTVLASSSTALATSASEITEGDSITLTATVTADTPTGTVEFFDGAVSLGSVAVTAGEAELVTTALAAGSRSITAVYSGDVDTNPSTSSPASVNVLTDASVALSVDDDTPTAGDEITFTATVTGDSPTGTVEFFDGAVSLGSAPVAGGEAALSTSSLAVGVHSVTAVYSGDGSNDGDTSSAQSVTVLTEVAISIETSDPNPGVGEEITLTATVTGDNPTGTVEFFDGDTSLGTAPLVDGVATITTDALPSGTRDVTAVYSGDANNGGSPSPTAEIEVSEPAIEVEVGGDDETGDGEGPPVDVEADGLEPDSEVDVVLNDTVPLGTFDVDAEGDLLGTVNLPEGLEPGVHVIVVIGTAADGDPVEREIEIFVDWSGTASNDAPVGGYVGVEPERVADSRTSTGKLPARGVLEFTVPAELVAADVTAVVVNLAVTQPEARGHLTVYPCDQDRPLASTLNYGAGDTISNLAIAGYELGDTLCVYTLSPAHVVVDLNGYFRASAPDRFAELDQTRLFDSRNGSGRVPAGQVVEIDVVGPGLASETAEAVNLYVASDQPVARGHLTAFPCGGERPVASNLNYAAGQTIGNNAITKIGEGGKVCVFTLVDTHIVVDLHGVMDEASGSQLTSLVPGRFVDTRSEVKVEGRSELVLDFGDYVPAGTVAVELNVAVTEAEGRGHVRVYPCDGELPLVASLNYPAGGSASGHVTATLGEGGQVCVFTLATAHIVVDVQGMHIEGVR